MKGLIAFHSILIVHSHNFIKIKLKSARIPCSLMAGPSFSHQLPGAVDSIMWPRALQGPSATNPISLSTFRGNRGQSPLPPTGLRPYPHLHPNLMVGATSGASCASVR